jgi:probable rRNA maturation factor
MIEVEVLGAELARAAPPRTEVRDLCSRAARAAGIADGHVAVEFVDAARIAALNREHRGHAGPTDVLSFPIDGVTALGGPAAQPDAGEGQRGAPVERELGDIVICPEHTVDLREAIVHGMLHLLGMDHETDAGEMLALQGRLLEERRR